MAAAMGRYLEDRSRIARDGDEGRRVATGRFALGTMVASYLSVYDAVLADRRAPHSHASLARP
jgi:hypothetical protein